MKTNTVTKVIPFTEEELGIITVSLETLMKRIKTSDSVNYDHWLGKIKPIYQKVRKAGLL